MSYLFDCSFVPFKSEGGIINNIVPCVGSTRGDSEEVDRPLSREN